MMTKCSRWLVGATTVLTSSPVAAQSVRGIVTEPGGGPARGAVVTLERATVDSGLVARSALSSSSGAYSIRAPGPGTFRLVARRIGSLPWRSDAFTLTAGQVHVLNVVLERAVRRDAAATLGTISITRATPCPDRENSGARIATLWEDARTVLLSSEIARRDRLVSSRQVRYKRDLELPLLQIISETFTAFDAEDVGGKSWFTSPPGDSLSSSGYWRETVPGVTEFHGPDASALLSEAFVRDHCFTLVDSAAGPENSIGLAFAPIAARMRDRAPADISGIIWFDEHSALRRVEFTWTKLRGDVRSVGGEVRFSRVADGPWIVDSWRLRMPLEVLLRGSQGTVRNPGLTEEGGITLSDSIDWTTANATVKGFVRASNGRPLAGARVRVLGTPVEAVSANDGRYSLEGVPLGIQYVVAVHDSLEAFGIRVGQTALLLDSAAVRNVTFTAPEPGQIAQSLCAGRPNERPSATLRAIVADSTTARPIQGTRVRLWVKGDESARASDVSSASTDSEGAFVFCDVLTDRVLVLSTMTSSQELTLRRGDVAVRKLFVAGTRK